MINQLVAALGQELGLTSKEIADAVWLALQMEVSEFSSNTAEEATRNQIQKRSTDNRSFNRDPSTSSSDSGRDDFSKQSQSTDAELHTPDTESDDQSGFGSELTLNVPDARSLREPLSLAKSLKPLLKKVSAGVSTVLDDAATVERIADEGIWMPVLKPALEPWLDLALVVDESISMHLWKRTITELQRLLVNYGVFRDVRVWSLVTDDSGQVGLRPRLGAAARRKLVHRPSELIDPSGRRLILIATDCVSAIWWDGTMLPTLNLWASSGPMAIMQMLPEWLWARTGLGFASAVRLHSLMPGVPNNRLDVRDLSPWDEVDLDTGIRVPVVTLESEPFLAWSKMLSAKGGSWSPGFVFDSSTATSLDTSHFQNPSLEDSAEHQVQRFRSTASPIARRLAGLLAAAPVIVLPVVRIIRDRLLPESRQIHVAEVFLGGLLRPLSELQSNTNPDTIRYEFLKGFREILLESIPTVDSLGVLNEVSSFVAKRLGLSIDAFTAILRNPVKNDNQELVDQSRPFAIVTAQILQQLGGEYARFAEELECNWQPYLQSQNNNRAAQLDFLRFFDACDPSRTLTFDNQEEHQYYTNFDSVRGDRMIELAKRTILLKARTNSPTCQIFTGHIGCGKSTELRRLQSELEAQGFHIVYFESTKDLDMCDVDITDIILAIIRQVTENLKKVDIQIKPGYFRGMFNEISDLLQMTVDLSYESEFDFSMELGKITAQAKESPKVRDRLRQYLEPRTYNLLEVFNKDVLGVATEKLKQQGKQGLVVIVDNLDRIDNRSIFNGTRTQPKYLFVDRGEQLRKINCHVVYTIPLILVFSNEYRALTNRVGGGVKPYVLPLVPVLNRDQSRHDQGLALLRQIAMARAFPDIDPTQRLDYIVEVFDSQETLDRLCLISGGHIRTLLGILYRCLQDEDPPISRSCLEIAIREHRDGLTLGITADEWELLHQVSQQQVVKGEEGYQSLLQSLFVFEYYDEQGRWFDVNPTLKETEEFRQFNVQK